LRSLAIESNNFRSATKSRKPLPSLQKADTGRVDFEKFRAAQRPRPHPSLHLQRLRPTGRRL